LAVLADIDPNATAQTYQMGVEVSGRYYSTGERFNFSGAFSLRALPPAARLALQGITLDPLEVRAGKSFTLTVRIKNVGGDTARGVIVALGNLAGQLPGAGASEVFGQAGGEEPFSAEVAVKYVGDLRPGDEVSVAFNMLTEAGAPGGRVFREPVLLGFNGLDGSTQYQTVPVAIKMNGGAAVAPAAQLDWTLLLLTLGFIALLGILLAVLIAGNRSAARTAAPPAKASPLPPQEAATPADLHAGELAVARPVTRLEQQIPLPPPPPPPPPQYGQEQIPPAQAHPAGPGPLPPVPPPPVASPVSSGPPPKGTPPDAGRTRPGPLDGYNIPGTELEPRYASPPQKPKSYTSPQVPMRVCPSCGNEVKMRFVKCPICGADLPPAS
jgi:hypothetical protein